MLALLRDGDCKEDLHVWTECFLGSRIYLGVILADTLFFFCPSLPWDPTHLLAHRRPKKKLLVATMTVQMTNMFWRESVSGNFYLCQNEHLIINIFNLPI